MADQGAVFDALAAIEREARVAYARSVAGALEEMSQMLGVPITVDGDGFAVMTQAQVDRLVAMLPPLSLSPYYLPEPMVFGLPVRIGDAEAAQATNHSGGSK